MAALQKAWCADTCWNGCKSGYPADGSNPSFGNCFVSTLAAWADRGFQDRVILCTFTQPGMDGEGWHFQLGTPEGTTIDPTYQQFDDGVNVKQLPATDPMHKAVAWGSIFEPNEEASLRERLNLLLERMEYKGWLRGQLHRRCDRRLSQNAFRVCETGARHGPRRAAFLNHPASARPSIISSPDSSAVKGIVSTHAHTILPTMPQRTAESRLVAPTPRMEVEITCVVETGIPK